MRRFPRWFVFVITMLVASSASADKGPISGKKNIAEMKAYAQLFDQKARKLVTKTNDVDYIEAELKKVLPFRSQGAWMISYNIRTKYLQAK